MDLPSSMADFVPCDRLLQKAYWLNLSLYDRNIFGSSSVVFDNLRKLFGNVRLMSGNVRLAFGTIFKKSSEIFGKWSEIFGNSSKTASSARLYNKKNITRYLEDMGFMFLWQELYLTSERNERVRYSSCHSNIKSISSRHRVISSIYLN